MFKDSDQEPSLTVSVNASRELSIDNYRRQYSLNEITTRVLNACIHLPEERDQWLEPQYILSFDKDLELGARFPLNPTAMMRAINGFDEVRHDMDGQPELISRSRRGSGSKTKYRIALDVVLADLRQPD